LAPAGSTATITAYNFLIQQKMNFKLSFSSNFNMQWLTYEKKGFCRHILKQRAFRQHLLSKEVRQFLANTIECLVSVFHSTQ
jgi:hypothetical protein